MISHKPVWNLFIATLGEKCCGLEARYPEVIPGLTWGSRRWSTEDKELWDSGSCDSLVGGEKKPNCGRYFYIEFIKKTKAYSEKYKLLSFK